MVNIPDHVRSPSGHKWAIGDKCKRVDFSSDVWKEAEFLVTDIRYHYAHAYWYLEIKLIKGTVPHELSNGKPHYGWGPRQLDIIEAITPPTPPKQKIDYSSITRDICGA